jgi:sterol desaturase/sphingolipid hydroxylase (fatty acid hydroxylase superfamily)
VTDKEANRTAARRRVASFVTALAAVGSAAGWLLATVFEYLQWPVVARWTLHVTVVLVAMTGLAALAVYVWRDEVAEENRNETD